MSTRYQTPSGVQIKGAFIPEFSAILSEPALAFLAKLHRKFEATRTTLLKQRALYDRTLSSGTLPDFLAETAPVRDGEWQVAPLPADLQKRCVEITGPVSRKMIINALNSGADSYMADFEDSSTPSWQGQVQGQINLYDAVRRSISLKTQDKHYTLNKNPATLLVRPRGWHLDESNLLIDGQPISGSIFDFGLFFFHNAKALLNNQSGPYFYLPKIEHFLEARLWNDIFLESQSLLGIQPGTIRATVLIETILAAFQMEEILFELREHSAGLNAGRWDYIFSAIKKFKNDPNFCLADRKKITMTVPFMRSYSLLLLKTCHKRKAPAIGGMSALIPIKNDPEANASAIEQVRADKVRDAIDGYDGGWIAHPGLVDVARSAWIDVLGTRSNQIDRQRSDVQVSAADLLNFQPETPITQAGVEDNIEVAILYMSSWLSGNGCVPINNLMEDAATAEISRAQIWQWIHSPKGKIVDGTKIDVPFIQTLIDKISHRLLQRDAGKTHHAYIPQAAKTFKTLSTSPEFMDFLTLALYPQLEH